MEKVLNKLETHHQYQNQSPKKKVPLDKKSIKKKTSRTKNAQREQKNDTLSS